MKTWDIKDFIAPLGQLSDSLESELSGLDGNIMAIDHGRMVKSNLHKGPIPSSVDGICITPDAVYYIEFKAESERISKELRLRYRHKASDSPLVFESFFPQVHGFRKEFILVLQDSRAKVGTGLMKGDGEIRLPEELNPFRAHDLQNQPSFYDSMHCMSCSKFVKTANSMLGTTILPTS